MRETPPRPEGAGAGRRARDRVNGWFRSWDEFADAQAPLTWGGRDRRGRWRVAALLVAEATAVLLLFGFLMERSVKDPAIWVIAGLVWVGAALFLVGMARNPVRTAKAGPRVLLGFFVLGVIAYLVFIVVVLSLR